jgi:hypothetical protein
MTKADYAERLAYVDGLCRRMVAAGLTAMKVTDKMGDVVLERPPFSVLPKDEKGAAGDVEDLDDPLKKIEKLSPEEQDRALRLGSLGSP